jgi:hypothetical protein
MHGSHSHATGQAHSHRHDTNERRMGIAALITGLFMVVGDRPAASSQARSRCSPMPATCSPTSPRCPWPGSAFASRARPADWMRTYGFDRFQVLIAFPTASLFSPSPPGSCTRLSSAWLSLHGPWQAESWWWSRAARASLVNLRGLHAAAWRGPREPQCQRRRGPRPRRSARVRLRRLVAGARDPTSLAGRPSIPCCRPQSPPSFLRSG